jgi:antagonist of KipI
MATLRVVRPGPLTSVQDLGRDGLGDQGIAPAGAMDSLALRLGNLVVGNPPNAAALEITLAGPILVAEGTMVVALAGAPFEAWLQTVGGARSAVAPWQALRVQDGDRLTIGGAQQGARAYLCVAGGIDVPPHHDSRATHLGAGLGGLAGRALRENDRLPVGTPRQGLEALAGRRVRRDLWPPYPAEATVRVILGPQAEGFTPDAVATFLSATYTVQPDSNRMGVRLSGPPLSHVDGADLTSEGIALGAVQVPHSGQPLVLMADRQTTGGYTKIATVIGADIGVVGQARPGARLRFEAVTVEAALAARRAQEALVDETSIERPLTWGPAEVAALLHAFAASGVGEMELEVEALRLVLRREARGAAGAGEPVAAVGENPPPTEAPQALTAPLLGIFYRSGAADVPPFVEVGDSVEAGQVVALIDVMKTLHEVRATIGGRITAILAENGALVEYDQPLMTFANP